MHRKASTSNTSEDNNNNKNKQHHHHHHHQHHHPVQHNDTSNTNDTLREGKLIRLELLSGGLGVDNEDIVDIDNQLEEAAAPLLQQKKKLVTKTDEKTTSSNLAGSTDKDMDKDVALIDCVAHAQANVTIRESCDCVYQQQHQPHHSHGSHLHQNPRYNIDPDQLIPAVELGGDIGFRKVANTCTKLAATSKHTAAAAAVTSKAADATVIATKDAAVKTAASKAAAIAAIKAAASTTTGLIDDSTAKVDWL